MSAATSDLSSLLERLRAPKPNATSGNSSAAVSVDVAAVVESPSVEAEVATAAAVAAAGETAAEPAVDAEADLQSLLAILQEDEVLLRRMLGYLYRSRKENPSTGGFVSIIILEKAMGLEREGGTFILNYMKSCRMIEADDKSRYSITVAGIGYLRDALIKNA
jgi:hypothetical protein